MGEKYGIGFAGSVVIDMVSEVLEPGNMVYSDGSRYLSGVDFESEKSEYSTGGLALNNSFNLKDMGVPYPIRVLGKIGQDENGQRVRDALAAHNLSDASLITVPDHPTSVCHVLYIHDSNGSVNRTFRYYFGAMGDYGPSDIDYEALEGLKIAMVGYSLLMPIFDREDSEYGAVIGRVLKKIQAMGIITCLDFVTPKRDKWWKFKRFQKTLRFVDILSIGEDQAEGITGIADEKRAVRSLVDDYGVKTAVVHCGNRGKNYLYTPSSGLIEQSIFRVPAEEYAGNVGAGDAFTAGLLHGIHQGWDEKKSLKYATAAAAISLGSLASTGAMRNEKYILNYMETRPLL
ncbi:MAG: carbohydrate kinase family protein [Candidatus Latescibacterota bacterium]